LSLTASTVSGAAYAWTGPNGFTSSLQNPYIPNATTAATGTYTVTVTVGGQISPPGTTSAMVIAPPTITCPADVTVNADSGQCYAAGVALGTPATTGTGVSVGNDAPAQYLTGVTTVTWTATDSCANTATCAQIVTVIDNQPPSITCPTNVTVSSDSGNCYATGVALGTPATGDNCGGSISVWNNAPAQFEVGATTVTWTAQDASGNTATCTQTVTVLAGAGCYQVAGCTVFNLNLGSPVTGDNCGGSLSVTNDAPAVYPLGTTIVTWTVTDGSGNTATTTQRVNVRDRTPPTITSPANVTVSANGGCTATNVVLGSAVTADNCSVGSVTNNAPAAYPLGQTVVTWTVTDGSGNTAMCAQTVTVNDTAVPTITCPANLTVTANDGNTATNVTLGSPVTADNCSVASVTNNAPTAYPVGTNSVTWTVTDGSGNTATCAQTVSVVLPWVPPGNPTLSRSGGRVKITWDGGVLQHSDDARGPYTDVEGATSPWPIAGTAGKKFYRVRGTGR
jgi:hypothetical protein